MNILIPVLTAEFNFASLNSVTSNDFIVLFLPIDKSSQLRGFAFAAQEASDCQKKIAEFKQRLQERKIECTDVVEWCTDVAGKIHALAQLRNCKKIILQKQTTHYFEEILNKLKENTEYSIELI